MKVYLATWVEDNQGESLTDEGADKRLLSYWFVKDLPGNDFRRYAGAGRLSGGEEEEREHGFGSSS